MIRSVALILGLVMVTGCKHATESVLPAVLIDGSETMLGALNEQLAKAIGKTDYQLGSADLTQSSTITMMPPPLGPNETHSLAMPIRFELMLDGETCYAIRSDTGAKIMLEGITCRAA